MAVFLTDEWFDEVSKLTSEAGDLNLPPSLANMKLNLKVDDAGNQINAYLQDGILHKGETDAKTTLSLDKETLKAIAIDFDMNQAMQAFMSGRIRVDGDMSQLMALQSAKPSAEQKALFDKIVSVTQMS